ncbi:orotate phosphoribosyltransferase-like protein [Methanonatronarchaeum sp. AMET6-2]|uniref:orotate phosphoribosyltransferase-like protein n=1 Tax=Methanonatronarchaeum sp. AMET6-2 TaxID=2933293 RepID=UPI00120B425A|nr:orotate phosphoribosyltransferase-like protein [Methanonatronarchaeum sp. AMET6-2]RZN63091.1 MAG: orotate phosphoribosyltransferase-like protein [Methanonatronarchaeia archaeon]UOY09956.1 orotate phosphoribosyltransferase-like protein [Methanonatronarchaeum sp. AMET6-2]
MSLEELVDKARKLKEKGLKTGSIADELNVSKKTAKWLVNRGTMDEKAAAPKDFFIEWNQIGKSSKRLRSISIAMCDLIDEVVDEVEVIVGIAVSGLPLAYPIAEHYDAEIAVILPRKQRWEPGEKDSKKKKGVISPNFSDPSGKKCVIVDDIITTGTTMRETITSLEATGADPTAAAILLDKKGIRNINGVPIRSLLRVGRVD